MPGEESLRLILEDETGEEQEYELIGTFAFEDRDYMGLLPVEKPEEGVLDVGTGDTEGAVPTSGPPSKLSKPFPRMSTLEDG